MSLDLSPELAETRRIVLAEIAEAPIKAKLDEEHAVKLNLPYGSRFGAAIYRLHDETRMVMHELYVPEIARQAGVGRRLMSGLIYTAKALDVDRFSGLITSQHTPRILDSLLGAAGVNYTERNKQTEYEEVVLPITVEQACMSLELMTDLDLCDEHGIPAVIQLGAVALEDFEKPEGTEQVLEIVPRLPYSHQLR